MNRADIRTKAADSLGLLLTATVDTNTVSPHDVITVPKIEDVAVDDERFRWQWLRAVSADQWRLIEDTDTPAGTLTLTRGFDDQVNAAAAVELYAVLSPEEWNNIIDNDSLPDLFRVDRATITLDADNTEYNATATASWLTHVEQVIRYRFRNTQSGATLPIEGEVPAVYPVQADNVLKLIVPRFNTDHSLVVEARRYYIALGNDTNTLSAPARLVHAKVKFEALKRIFQKLGTGAKRVYGQQMVLSERELASQEARHMGKVVKRDYSAEEYPVGGPDDPDPFWGW